MRMTPEFRDAMNNAIELIPLEERTEIRTLASKLGLTKSSLHNYFRAGVFRCHTARAKPLLNDDQQVARVRFAFDMVKLAPSGELKFCDMLEYVHLDEKWFYLTKDKERYYLGEHEEIPYITVKNKNYIIKVMFLVAVARPRWDAHNHRVWDGKVGCWPFVVYEPVERTSKNRPAGTLEMKSYTVDDQVYREALCRMVIPRIEAVWPASAGKRVVLQHDNAKPHVTADDLRVLAACAEGGWDMSIKPQPANSPDYNALDLGFFASLQTLQHKKKARTIEQLVNNVDAAFQELRFQATDRVFVTLQSVLQASMEVNGSNKYMIPHLYKNQLEDSRGLLPLSVSCSSQVFIGAKEFLSSITCQQEGDQRT